MFFAEILEQGSKDWTDMTVFLDLPDSTWEYILSCLQGCSGKPVSFSGLQRHLVSFECSCVLCPMRFGSDVLWK